MGFQSDRRECMRHNIARMRFITVDKNIFFLFFFFCNVICIRFRTRLSEMGVENNQKEACKSIECISLGGVFTVIVQVTVSRIINCL